MERVDVVKELLAPFSQEQKAFVRQMAAYRDNQHRAARRGSTPDLNPYADRRFALKKMALALWGTETAEAIDGAADDLFEFVHAPRIYGTATA